MSHVNLLLTSASVVVALLCLQHRISSLTRTARSLEKEVQEVKATLQNMLARLREEKEEEEEDANELEDDELVENGTVEEDEDEDQYFSDSWDI